MDRKIEDVLYEALKPVNEPEPELNRRILDRRLKRDMRKLNLRKTAVAAAIGILVAAGGVSAYAASQNLSLLSLFQGESKEVQKSAEKLLDKKVEQEKSSNKEQSQLATFKIREAIVDKNQVKVQVEVKAVEPEKYLLVYQDAEPELDPVGNLDLEGVSGKQTIAEYAESLGKKCLKVEAVISGADVDSQSIDNHMEKDGTMLYNISFENTKKSPKLKYICETIVVPEEGDIIRDKINFTLKDNSNLEVVKYLPVKEGKVPGTDLVIDKVTFVKSDLEMMCNVKYHYAGKSKEWENTKDFDIGFYLLDSDGKVIESNEGGGTQPDEKDSTVLTQSWSYSLKDLPKTVSFQVKDVMEKTVYGTVDVKLAK